MIGSSGNSRIPGEQGGEKKVMEEYFEDLEHAVLDPTGCNLSVDNITCISKKYVGFESF